MTITERIDEIDQMLSDASVEILSATKKGRPRACRPQDHRCADFERQVEESSGMTDMYALKRPSPDGSEWIQEHDSLESALDYQSHSGGVLVRRQVIAGPAGIVVGVEVDDSKLVPSTSKEGYE